MPTSADRVRTLLGISTGRPVDEEALQDAVDAANSWVASVCTDLPPLVDEDGAPVDPADVVWPAHADYATTVQAANLYNNRSSIGGRPTYADGGTSRLRDLDPEVRSLLGLGEYQDSVVS